LLFRAPTTLAAFMSILSPPHDRADDSAFDLGPGQTFEIIGTRSAMLVLGEAFFGARRFDDFARRAGIGEPAAAAGLKELTADGLLERVPYQEPGQRTRYEYQLTKKGRDLLPVITALLERGDTWAAEPGGPRVRSVHRGCEAPVRPRLLCDNGHDVALEELEVQAGPGLISAWRGPNHRMEIRLPEVLAGSAANGGRAGSAATVLHDRPRCATPEVVAVGRNCGDRLVR